MGTRGKLHITDQPPGYTKFRKDLNKCFTYLLQAQGCAALLVICSVIC